MRPKISSAVVFALALAALAVFASPAAALPAGNLLANSAAEAPPTKVGELLTTPSSWAQLAAASPSTQAAYDSCYGGSDTERNVLEREVGEKINGGARFFFAGDEEISELAQEVAVGPEATGRQLLIGGYFGGYSSQEDHASLSAVFLSSGNVPISSIGTVPVTAAERGNVDAMLARQASGVVPANTAKIRFILIQIRTDGADNDGYADSLFATFDATPPAQPAPTGDATCPYTPPVVAKPGPVGAASVQITSGPAKETAQSKAVFTFTGTAGGSFECSLDGAAFKPCTSGKDFGPVKPGDHLFEVRQKLNGATSAPASYKWTVDLPKKCVLRVARARVFVYSKKSKARLVIHYTSYRAAKVNVAYRLQGSKGQLALGDATQTFSKVGVFRLPVVLDKPMEERVRAAKSFQVTFKIPGTPSSCGSYYKKKLTIPQKVSGQTVWFQSDSRFAP